LLSTAFSRELGAESVEQGGLVRDEVVAGDRVAFALERTLVDATVEPVAIDVEGARKAPDGPFPVELLLVAEPVSERRLAASPPHRGRSEEHTSELQSLT